MRTKTLHNAKLVVTVESIKGQKEINTVSIFDNRTNEYWSKEQTEERGINNFINMDNMKESLNWNLNGDSSKYQFKWCQTGNKSQGIAYIFQ